MAKPNEAELGQTIPKQVEDPALWKACAQILESTGHPPEAAELFERCGLYEKAAAIHIASKNLAAAAPLMARVASPKLQLAFAQAKEAQGRWQEAAVAYEAGGAGVGGLAVTVGHRPPLLATAGAAAEAHIPHPYKNPGDVSSAVRLLLEKLDAPGRAAAIVRKAGPGAAPDAAAAVARQCLAARDARAAVEFLLLAGQMDQARGAVTWSSDCMPARHAGSVKVNSPLQVLPWPPLHRTPPCCQTPAARCPLLNPPAPAPRPLTWPRPEARWTHSLLWLAQGPAPRARRAFARSAGARLVLWPP